MTEAELHDLLLVRSHDRFADTMAQRIVAAGAAGALFRMATSRHEAIPKALRHQLLFRSAYVLERIYFTAQGSFLPHADDFCRRAFPECVDESVRRHFGKIMANLLDRTHPDPQTLERIAEAAAEWAVDPQSKVAVRVWAMEVLKRCRGRVAWVDEVWNDVVETQARGATPGIANRLRRSWLR